MTTIKISVKNKRDAILLYRMLQKVSFIDKIEKSETPGIHLMKNQYGNLHKIIEDQASSDFFTNIEDPVKWQRNLRDEWE